MKSITLNWLTAARDDLELIQEIIHNETLTNLLAFHSQQAIEKSFKAILEEYDGNVPRMHNLETLLPKVNRHVIFMNAELELLEDLDKLYIDSRYPGDFGLLPNGKPTVDEAKKFYKLALLIHEAVTVALK
jgi:HEPN domain-containing protein